MSEKKLFEKILDDQESFEEDKGAIKARELCLEVHEELLNLVLVNFGQEEAEVLQAAFEEYKKVEAEVFKELGGKTTLDDVRARIPDNLWLDIINPDNILPKEVTEGISFDEIWEAVKEELDKEELEEAKKNNKIN